MDRHASMPRPAPVLMYHDLAPDPSSVPAAHRPYVLTPAAFEAQMQALGRLGVRGVSLAQGLAARTRSGSGEGPLAVLTFDDGHASNATLAAPILQRHGFAATFFVTASWIGEPPYMGWGQLRDLVAAGMEIGTHSLTHRPPASLSPADLDHELRESRRLLETGLGIQVLTGSAPTGFHNPRIGGAARAAGYTALCVSRIGLWRPGADPFAIPRVPVKDSTTLAIFESVCRGEAATLRGLRARQAVRDALKRGLGVGGYLRLRRALLALRGGGR
jgi:peptidoglycan/xylan/chitin deacetylase (PgdA/CDA1 family)